MPKPSLILMFDFGNDTGLPKRRIPTQFTNADRVGDDHPLSVLLRFWKVIQPMFREVDDDPLVRSRRQNAPAGQRYLGALARYPHIDAGVGADDLVISQAVLPGNVQ